MAKCRLLSLGLALALMGCFPYVSSYVHLEAPGVTNTGACAGPPVFASYEVNGARFGVTLEAGLIASRSTTGFLRVRAPSGMVVSMPEQSAYVTPEGRAPIAFTLSRVEPAEGRLAREYLAGQGTAEHRFEFSGLPPITFAGELKLPTIYLDAAAVTSPLFKFHRRPYAGVVPLNC
jgi:hypothetical protein